MNQVESSNPAKETARTVVYAPPRRYAVPQSLRQCCHTLLTGAARPLRFALIGGLCALIQLTVLFFIARAGLHPVPANIVAYLLSAQVNFWLSDRFIWHDRRKQRSSDGLGRRWLSFHLSIAGTFLLNELVFVAARAIMPDLIAAAAGIGVAAVVNFLIQDRLTFR